MPSALLFSLRFVHVLAAMLWIGGGLTMALVVGRTMMTASPDVRGAAMSRVAPAAHRFLTWAATITLFSGIALQWQLAGELDYRSGTWNVLLGAALVLAVVMLGLAGGVTGPAMRALNRMAAAAPGGTPPHPQAAGLQKRMMVAGWLANGLGLVALALMVWATSIGP